MASGTNYQLWVFRFQYNGRDPGHRGWLSTCLVRLGEATDHALFIEQAELATGRWEPQSEVLACEPGCHSASGSPVQESYLQQIWLIDLLDGILFFADCGRESRQPNRAAGELIDDRGQQLAIDLVQAELVDLHAVERVGGNPVGYRAVVKNLGDVAHSPQQAVGDSGGAARPPGNLYRAGLFNPDSKNVCRAHHNNLEIIGQVEIQVQRDAKAASQRRADQTRPGSCAHQGKLGQVQLDRAS